MQLANIPEWIEKYIIALTDGECKTIHELLEYVNDIQTKKVWKALLPMQL